MKNFFIGFALIFSLLVFATGFMGNPMSRPVAVGEKIHKFEVSNQYGAAKIGDTKSHYTLLTFWNSTEADSRVACWTYDNAISVDSDMNGLIDFVAINIDESPVLFNEIVMHDRLNDKNQFRLNEKNAAEVRSVFKLDEGTGSVLIGRDGKIIAFNPTVDQLKALN